MHDAGPELLRQVADAPEDSAPRLVYADHLNAIGDDAHGELIVVQHRLAALVQNELDEPESVALRTRERVLVSALLDELDVPERVVRFARGFVDTLSLNAATAENLEKRISHPAFAAVQTLCFETDVLELAAVLPRIAKTLRRVEGYFTANHLRELLAAGAAIDEASSAIMTARDALAPLDRLNRLDLRELFRGFHLEIALLEDILQGDRMPTVKHLSLELLAVPHASLLDVIQAAPLAARAESLVVWRGGDILIHRQ